MSAYSAEGLPAEAAESERYYDHQWKSESKKERKPPVHPEKDRQYPQEFDSFVE